MPAMTFKAANGTGMRTHVVRVMFVPGGPIGRPKKLERSHIPEVRRLLRTSLPIGDIAKQFGVTQPCLSRFCKRHRICDLKDRARMVSIARQDARFAEVKA
jgi:hypothetical protein